MWALVPFKGAVGAKRRLAEHLSEDERTRLVHAMLNDVLAALAASRTLAGVLLVSRAPDAPEIAAKHGAVVYRDNARDLSGAVVDAGDYLTRDKGARGTFFIPGDVPLITADEVDLAVAGHTDVTLIPDQYDIGTNGALSSPANRFTYLFDGKSFKPHCREAEAVGVAPRVLRLPGFGIDIDTIDELSTLSQLESTSQTSKFLQTSGIASRLNATHNRSAKGSTLIEGNP